MGTPNYPTDFGRALRDQRVAVADAFTASQSRTETRPWVPCMTSRAISTAWSSTTSTSFGSRDTIAGVRSHPNVNFWVRVQSPAGGSEMRILYSDGSTVLYGPAACALGLNEINSTFIIPGSVSYYGEFYVSMQARSVVSGETTYATVSRAYCSA